MLSTSTQVYLIAIGSLTSGAAWLGFRKWALVFWGMLALGGAYLGAVDAWVLIPIGILFNAYFWLAQRRTKSSDSSFCIGLQLALVSVFFAHAVPGFAQHVWAAPKIIKAGSIAFDPLYNIDQVMAMTLALRCIDEPWARPPVSWWFVLTRAWSPALGLVALMIVPACAAGFVRFDLRLPAWWTFWLVHNLFLVVVPEELFFRGLIPRTLHAVTWPRRLGPREVTAVSSVLFGLGHVGGGPVLMILGTMAGGFYALAGQRAQNLAGSMVAHLLLNTVHFFCFSYPSLR